MKKIVSLAIACMLILSCFAINAFAASESFTVTASEPDANGYFTLTANSPIAVKKFAVAFTFAADAGVELVNADSLAAATFAKDAVFAATNLSNLEMTTFKVADAKRSIHAEVYTTTSGVSDDGDLFAVTLKLTNGKLAANPFSIVPASVYKKAYGGLNVTTADDVTYRITKTNGAAIDETDTDKVGEVIFNVDNIIAKDEPKVELGAAAEELESAKVANGTVADTLTFVAKVSAEYKDADYGVIVAGKKFFGGKESDVTETDGIAWDGSFEIVLTNITTKGTAGEKAYQYFVGDAVTDSATVNVVAE